MVRWEGGGSRGKGEKGGRREVCFVRWRTGLGVLAGLFLAGWVGTIVCSSKKVGNNVVTGLLVDPRKLLAWTFHESLLGLFGVPLRIRLDIS